MTHPKDTMVRAMDPKWTVGERNADAPATGLRLDMARNPADPVNPEGGERTGQGEAASGLLDGISFATLDAYVAARRAEKERMAAASDCLECGATISAPRRRAGAEYCSTRCAGGVALGLGTGAVGAIGELVVCADLLRRGYGVFRSVSPACSCDLIAMRGAALLRVEVTTGHIGTTGRMSPHSKNVALSDVVAVVLHTEIGSEIHYNPKLPEAS
jgi:hypothetical protein